MIFESQPATSLPSQDDQFKAAKHALDGFALRTGLTSDAGDPRRRYLWTDSLAVESFFNIAKVLRDDSYAQLALKLIDLIHHTLGRHRRDDIRQGWLSGLSEQAGEARPTAGGLRIGKKLPERLSNEAFNQRLEWERDGQYFHYLTRWINALLRAGEESGERKYNLWAAQLCAVAGEAFIEKAENGRLGMYWKMSSDLSRPLVSGMGAHDPLEGYICCQSALLAVPEMQKKLAPLMQNFALLCQGQNWSTTDPLGIGALLLNCARSKENAAQTDELAPKEIRPNRLLADALAGLAAYLHGSDIEKSSLQRLAFRECGLSLGLRTCSMEEDLAQFMPLANEIETFWLSPKSQRSPTWKEHLDISSVTLAASVIRSRL